MMAGWHGLVRKVKGWSALAVYALGIPTLAHIFGPYHLSIKIILLSSPFSTKTNGSFHNKRSSYNLGTPKNRNHCLATPHKKRKSLHKWHRDQGRGLGLYEPKVKLDLLVSLKFISTFSPIQTSLCGWESFPFLHSFH